MDRFTKIILEQYKSQASTWKAGDYGSIRLEQNASFTGLSQVQSLANSKIIDENYQFVMIMGKNTPPIGMPFVLKNLNHAPYWKSEGGYVYVVMQPMYWNGKNNQQIKQAEYKKYKKSYVSYPVVRFPLKNSDFKNFDLDSKVSIDLKKIDNNYTMSVVKYNKLLQDITKQKADKAAADEKVKADAELNKQKYNAAKAEYVQIKNKALGKLSNSIDVNNLTRGTIDTKAFQELVYLVARGLNISGKFVKQMQRERSTGWKAIANWNGDIDPTKSETLKVLGQISTQEYDSNVMIEDWNNDEKQKVIQGLTALMPSIANESISSGITSTNYFQGINMNIKLKDLLQEQSKNLINETDHDEVDPYAAQRKAKQKKDAEAAQGAEQQRKAAEAAQKAEQQRKAAEAAKMTNPCVDKLDMDLVKQVIQYSSGRGGGFRGNGNENWWYHGTTPINKNQNDLKSGISAIVHDMWGLYVLAVNHLVADFCKAEGDDDCKPNWAKVQGFVGILDDDAEAGKWYFGNNYHTDTKSEFWRRSGKYIKKASELGKKYGTVIKSCGATNHVTLYNQCRYDSINYNNIRDAWLSMRGKMMSSFDANDNVTFKLEYPSGTNYYTVSTDI